MLNNVFVKTLYERRWSTLIWTLSVFAMTMLVMLFFPVMRDSFGEALTDVPESMQALLGSAADYQNINGYIDIQVIAQMIFLTLIMAIVLGTSLLAGDENNGTLQTLLTQPVRRATVYLSKAAALGLFLAVAASALFAGAYIGALAVGETPDAARLVQASSMVWLGSYTFGMIAFVVGAWTGKRGIAGIVAGFYAFISYMVTSLAASADALEKLNYLSLIKYFNTPSVMKHGVDSGNIAVFVLVISTLLLVGLLIFRRRDIQQ